MLLVSSCPVGGLCDAVGQLKHSLEAPEGLVEVLVYGMLATVLCSLHNITELALLLCLVVHADTPGQGAASCCSVRPAR